MTGSNAPTPYLLAWRLDGRKVVVVGGGAIGTAKIELLLATGARITVVDPTPSDRVDDLGRQGRVRVVRRRARPTDLVGARLLVAATGSTATNRRLRRWARPLGAVVNAVDDPPNCDVTVPSVIRRGPATIAISTGGTTPAGARFLREELTEAVDRALPDRTGDLLTGAAAARRELRDTGRYRYDYRAWRERYFEPGLAALRGGTGRPVDPGGRELPDGADRPVTADRPDPLGGLADRFVADFDHRAKPDDVLRAGSVALVGAGPGGADLITVRGARTLAGADVVVYDRLADPDLLALAPPAAERIPVGKGKGFGARQEDINRLLVERATVGDRVVRLKGGDPFVFGRGLEEVEAVTAAGLAVEVVPGVSSAVGAPGLAGIPLTDRRRSASFTVVTGHRARPGTESDPGTATGDDRAEDARWAARAAGADTLVVLMAATTAADVARRLLDGGRPGSEPVAFVHAAATPDQRSIRRTLAEAAVEGCPFPAPSIMVVGAVACGDSPTPAPLRPSASAASSC